jgi:hypothetical protein
MNKTKEIDYGILSDISKGANCNLFGDCSDSTISRRTTKGFKKILNLNDKNISDQNAEHIVHAAMIGTAACLFSKSSNKKVTGSFILLGLFICYQS